MTQAPDPHKSHQLGVWLMVISALTFSTAGLFTKGVQATAWEVIFWRGIFAAVITLAFLVARQKVGREWRQMGRAGWAVAIIGAISTSMFIASFKATSMANVALIYASAPMLTATLAWIFMRERMALPVLLGAIGAFVGVAIIVSGSVTGSHWSGDLLAIGMTIGMGIIIVIYRRYPNTPAALPAIFSSVLLLPAALFFSAPFLLPFSEILICAGFGAVFALASVLLAEASKRVPSGEAALLSSLEAPLAPLWAWLVFSEIAPVATFIGGGIILLAVITPQLIRTKSVR